MSSSTVEIPSRRRAGGLRCVGLCAQNEQVLGYLHKHDASNRQVGRRQKPPVCWHAFDLKCFPTCGFGMETSCGDNASVPVQRLRPSTLAAYVTLDATRLSPFEGSLKCGRATQPSLPEFEGCPSWILGGPVHPRAAERQDFV